MSFAHFGPLNERKRPWALPLLFLYAAARLWDGYFDFALAIAGLFGRKDLIPRPIGAVRECVVIWHGLAVHGGMLQMCIRDRLDITVEDQLLTGNGTGNNIEGLLNRSGLQTATCAGMNAAIKAIKKAKVGIKKNTPGFRADALLINDEDWDELTNAQDANNQFLAGGPFYGAYGSSNGPVAVSYTHLPWSSHPQAP